MTLNQTTHEIDTSRLQALSFAKLERKIRSSVGRAISDFSMIEAGDRVMVCVSGGADSYTMLDILLMLQKSAPIEFELIAVNLDQKQPDFPEHILPAYLRELGVDFRIVEEDTYSVVKRLVPLYYSAIRPVVNRDGVWIMVDDERFRFEPGEEPEMKSVRFRTLGCYPLSGALESTAATLPEIIQEMLLATHSEREDRVIDFDQSGSMEEKKREGYF